MTRPLTLFHVSDPHFGAEDVDALAAFARAVAVERPDAILCTGDITMRGTPREFAAAARWFAALEAPVAIEPGNHDMPYYWEMVTRLRRPFARFAAFRQAAATPVALPGLTLLSLPTVVPAQWRLNWSKGYVTRDVLASALDTARDAAPGLRLALTHHPLIDADTEGQLSEKGGSTRGGKAALAALAAEGVDAVLSGHVHDGFDLTLNAGGHPIRLIGAGTISTRLRATPPGYNRLTWSARDGLAVEAMSLI